ncbi:LysR family transcriptional regulator [Sphingomonas histidinilytica]|nr:LysR family transcriptional regulator [Rhizorhabdus histidinilytica]
MGITVEFRQLNYFIAVAEEANLTAASRRLHISQPPITRQIRQLEEELGAQLFHRSSKGVQLTAAGKAFLSEAQRLVQIAKSASEKCRAADRGEIGQLMVGHYGATIHAAVPHAIRRFQKARPDVSVQIRRATKREQYEQLRDGRMGVGFARHYLNDPDLETICVSTERLYAAARIGCLPDTSPGSFKLATLEDVPVIVFPQGGRPSFADHILDMLARANVCPANVDTAEDVFAAIAMTMISDSVCIIPESVAELKWPELECVPLDDPSAVSPVNCIFLKRGRAPVVDAFLEIIVR